MFCDTAFLQCCFLNWFLSMTDGHAQIINGITKHVNYRPLMQLHYRTQGYSALFLIETDPTLYT